MVLGFLCICVFMQVLGVSASMWNPVDAGDVADSSVSEDITLISVQAALDSSPPVGCIKESTSHCRSIAFLCTMFHPPCVRR